MQDAHLPRHTSRVSYTNELLLSFEERIFEKQLVDCKKLYKQYIEIYEDKEYWLKEMASYMEEHSFGASILASNRIQQSLVTSNSQG